MDLNNWKMKNHPPSQDEIEVNAAIRYAFSVSGLLEMTYFYFLTPKTRCALIVTLLEKTSTNQRGLENVELVHECFLKQSRMGTARMK